MMMDIYQECTKDMAAYPGAGEGSLDALIQCTLGINKQAGKISRSMQAILDPRQAAAPMVEQLGVLLWWTARCADELGVSLEELAELNLGEWMDKRLAQAMDG